MREATQGSREMAWRAAWLSAAALLAAVAWAGPRADFYVAPSGNDAWSGRLPKPNAAGTDGPFATLERARQAVRKLQASRGGRAGGYTVLIRGGTYYLRRPLMFGPQDSGAPGAPGVWAAYPGERVVISGGQVIRGWKKGPGKLWHADVPEVKARRWYFRQLWVNGRRRTRARHPNKGYLKTVGPLPGIKDPHKHRGDPEARKGFVFAKGDIKRWPDLEDVNLWLFHSWTASLHWIAKVDEQKRTVIFTNLSNWPVGYWERQQRYFLENCREALDAPGEWYLDRRRGRLYYWPVAGEDMTKAQVIAPRLRHIVELRGDPEVGMAVENLVFRGLSFQHADWVFGPKDHTDGQAAFFLDAAIYATGARNCVFEGCQVARVGEYGIWLSKGCRGNRIVRCELRDLGGGGIKLGETVNRPGVEEAGGNVVDNCFIHDGGRVFPAGVGVWIGRSSFNRVTHNEICDFYYTGVSVGWDWGFEPSTAHDNIIEYNHIHHIGLGVLSDMGGIYTLGRSPGTRLRNNLIHDIYMYLYGAGGIYPDQGSTDLLIENNICYNTDTGGFTQNWGRDNVVRNNIFAFSRSWEVFVNVVERDQYPFKFEHNVVYSTTGIVASPRWGEAAKLVSDYNCYWDTKLRDELDIAGWPFDEWQGLGWDKHSVVADPLFVDPARRDLRLRPDSPALKLGFRPIDVDRIGLYGPPQWRTLPERTPNRKPMIRPVRVRKRLRNFAEDFEKTPLGHVPAGVSYTPVEGASVGVTDELARSGKRCLKFVDAAGLKYSWQPHIHWDPFVLRRVARLSFDVRLGPRAILQHEWRDWRGNPYRVGPSLRFVAGGPLIANGRQVARVPVDRWIHVEIICPVGVGKQAGYRLKVQAEGEKPVVVENVPFGTKRFRALTWLGFVSDATVKSVIYLDNVRLQTRKP